MGHRETGVIDLDDAKPTDVLRVWYNLRYHGAKCIRGRVSSGGSGCHIEAVVPWDEWPMYRIRELVGDDPQRIAKDREKPWRPANVRFDRKGDSEAGSWVGDPTSLIRELYRGREHRLWPANPGGSV